MNILQYLQAKYGVTKPTTMTCAEADAFGISYPLQTGWLEKHGKAEITDYMHKRLVKAMSKKANGKKKTSAEFSKKALAVLANKSGPVSVIKARAAAYRPGKKVEKSQYRGSFIDPNSDEFLQSYQWRTLRFDVIAKYGNACQCCGATPDPKNGISINVDHIRPRKTHPHLALDINNLQILCNVCNHGKSNRHVIDFRPDDDVVVMDGEYSDESINRMLKSL